jgi:hypothetical protein
VIFQRLPGKVKSLPAAPMLVTELLIHYRDSIGTRPVSIIGHPKKNFNSVRRSVPAVSTRRMLDYGRPFFLDRFKIEVS